MESRIRIGIHYTSYVTFTFGIKEEGGEGLRDEEDGGGRVGAGPELHHC
jgi:hypothetical protein